MLAAISKMIRGQDDGLIPKLKHRRNYEREIIDQANEMIKIGGINAVNERGETALFLMVKNDIREGIKVLVHAGADVNKSDKNGRTPLHYAASFNYYSLVCDLIAAGANVNLTNIHGETPLHAILEDGKSEAPQIQFRYIDPIKRNFQWVTRELVNAGADVNKSDNLLRTPLFLAARLKDPHLIHILTTAGADTNQVNTYGETPLFVAAYDGNSDCVQVLLDAGADRTIVSKNGYTICMAAGEDGHYHVINQLHSQKLL